MKSFIKKIFLFFVFIFLIELLSFNSYFYPWLNTILFFSIIIATLIVSLWRLEYGILVAFSELFIGSKGYLFYFDCCNFLLSLRIALWLIIMSVFLTKIIILLIQKKQFDFSFLKFPYYKYFYVLFIFIFWGFINGFLNKNSLDNIFFDFNGWLFFSYIFPVIYIVYITKNIEESFKRKLIIVFLLSTVWISVKTLILLFIFSHNIFGAYEIYRWVRITGIGEITTSLSGFSRIFIQSQIFLLPVFFLVGAYFFQRLKESDKLFITNKDFIFFGIASLLLSAIFTSFSRSFWIGLIGGFLIFFIILLINKISIKKIIIFNTVGIIVAVIGFIFMIFTAKFPYPKITFEWDATNILVERAGQITGEAGVASRWNLLPELWKKIIEKPIIGQGFGTVVTYISNDPRVLEKNSTGKYTTYAFEWGWLDVWLKLGFIGLVIYIFIYIKIFKDYIFSDNFINLGLVAGLASMALINFFSPYVNHPIGIGYLILCIILLDNLNKNIFY